jgi:hypothetical protein
MVDTSPIKKTKADWISWKNRPYASNAGSEEKQRQAEKWSALAAFIRKHNGWVTSTPNNKTLRIECLPGSELPSRLKELGYNIVERGTVTRVTGTDTINPANERYAGTMSPFAEYSVLEIRLDGR